MPVEQVRAGRPRDEARGAPRIAGPSSRRSRPSRRRGVPEDVFEIADQAHRTQSLRAQCAHRDRQFRRCDARTRGHPVVGRPLGAGARRGGVGAQPPLAGGTARRACDRSARARERSAGRRRMDGSARGDGGLMATLVCLGLGYCARHYVSEFGKRFDRVIGTTRNAQRAAALAQERLGGRPTDTLVFDGTTPSRELAAAIARADALLISAAPAEGRDPVLAALEDEIARAPRLKSAVYLSSLGVYGDSGGAWIDEAAETSPALARRGRTRIDAELKWRALGARQSLPVAILRLGGIYGPGQNAMVRLRRGTEIGRAH